MHNAFITQSKAVKPGE